MFWVCCNWTSGGGKKKVKGFYAKYITAIIMENIPLHKTHQHDRNQHELPQKMTAYYKELQKPLFFFLWPYREGNLDENFFQTL